MSDSDNSGPYEMSRDDHALECAGGSDAQPIVLAWSTRGSAGGSERRMAEVAGELVQRGIPVYSFATAGGDSAVQQMFARSGATPVCERGAVRLAWRVARTPSLFTWHFGLRVGLPLRILRLTPAWRAGPLLAAANGLDEHRPQLAQRLDSLTRRALGLTIANTEAAAHRARSIVRGSKDRVCVLPSAIPHFWVSATSRPARRLVRVAMIGNRRPEKRQDIGIDCFVELADPETTLSIYTNDADWARQRVARLPLAVADRITLVEGVAITPQIVDEIDVLLHPSSSESLPRAAIEARCRGAWVVAFDVGELGPLAISRVAPQDVPALTGALREACDRVRSGTAPHPISFVTVPQYADRLLELTSQVPPP